MNSPITATPGTKVSEEAKSALEWFYRCLTEEDRYTIYEKWQKKHKGDSHMVGTYVQFCISPMARVHPAWVEAGRPML